MSAPNVTVNRTNGGIGRQATGTDYYSGLLMYLKSTSTLPTNFGTGNQVRPLHSILDLVALGIDGKSGDETASTATWLCTNAGVAGETVTISFTDPITGVVTVLGTGIVPATPSTTTTATALKNAINALTYIHGFTATSSTATVTIQAAPGYGAMLNTGTPYAVTYSATPTVAGTLTQNVVSGVGSEQDVIYYHTREAFRAQGILSGKAQGKIWLGIYKVGGSTYSSFTEVQTMQSFAGGQINQIGVWATTSAFATSHVTALNSVATTLAANNTPLHIVYQPDISGTSDVSTLSAVRALNSQYVSVTVGQDGANVGNRLYKAFGKSIGCLGVTLGAIALAKVNESIIWRGKFNIVDTLEYTSLSWANGTLLSASGSALSTLIDTVDGLGYIFLRNESSPESSALFGGVFFNNDSTCTSTASDYAYIPNVRTINKAAVGVRAAILPALGGTVYFNANGTLTVDSLNYLQHLGDTVIGGKSGSTTGSMAAAGEISDGQTIIDPTQNVQSANSVAVTMKIVQAGVVRYFTINIGFAASLTQ